MKIMKNALCAALATASLMSIDLSAAEKHVTRMDVNGNGVTVWQTYSFNGTIIQTNLFDGSSWGTPSTISSSETATEPRIAAIESSLSPGEISAVAIWLEINGSITSAYASMLPYASYGWTTPAQISTNGEDVQGECCVFINESGNIIASWSSYDTNFNRYIRSATASLSGSNVWNAATTVSGP